MKEEKEKEVVTRLNIKDIEILEVIESVTGKGIEILIVEMIEKGILSLMIVVTGKGKVILDLKDIERVLFLQVHVVMINVEIKEQM